MAKLSPEEVESRLQAAVRRRMGEGASLEKLTRLSGGASQETWSFDAQKGSERIPLILRRDTPNAVHAIAKAAEYELLEAARKAKVPVPALHFLLAKEDGLGNGYVMGRVEGETIPRKILRDEPYKPALPKLAAQCGAILARIHSIPLSTLRSFPPIPTNESPAKALLEGQVRLLDSFGEPHPAFELGIRWLQGRIPPAGRICLVHGDFRNGNLLIGPDGVRAVLDWELAHLGDPMEDLGWLCVKSWRFGVNEKPVGGFGSREELFAAYEKASGIRVDPETVRFWEVYGNLKWGIICMLQASFHLRNLRRSVELAALGRRVCEMEWDILEMIG